MTKLSNTLGVIGVGGVYWVKDSRYSKIIRMY